MSVDPDPTPIRLKGALFVLTAAVLWGTTGTAQAFAPGGASPLSIGALRLTVGGFALLGLAFSRGALQLRSDWPWGTTALAAGSMAAYQPFFFSGVARTGVAVGTIVTIGSAPILAGLLGYLVRGERPGRRWALATPLAIIGCTLLIKAGDHLSVDSLGVAFSLAAGLAYAAYAVVSKTLLVGRPPDAVMAVVFCLAALLLAPILLTADLGWLGQMRGLAVILHLGLVATAAAYMLFSRGLALVPVADAVTLSLAEPLTAGALGLLVLGERFTPYAGLGTGLVLLGLALLTVKSAHLRR